MGPQVRPDAQGRLEYFRELLGPMEVTATEAVRRFLRAAFVDTGLVKEAERLLDVRVRLSPEGGSECAWSYWEGVGRPLCRDVCGRYEPGEGLIEVFLDCLEGRWSERFPYTLLHLIVHHLQARAGGLTMTTLPPRAACAEGPHEVEAAYLARLFLLLSRSLQPSLHEVFDLSLLWRPLLAVMVRVRGVRAGGRAVENPFRIVRGLLIELRDLDLVASIARRGTGFRAALRNPLGVGVEVPLESVRIGFDEVCFTSDSGRLSVCYEGDARGLPGEGFEIALPSPLRVDLRELGAVSVSYDPPRARVSMETRGGAVEAEGRLVFVGRRRGPGAVYGRWDEVRDALSLVRAPLELPVAACLGGTLELAVPSLARRVEAPGEELTLDLSSVKLSVSDEVCQQLFPPSRVEGGGLPGLGRQV